MGTNTVEETPLLGTATPNQGSRRVTIGLAVAFAIIAVFAILLHSGGSQTWQAVTAAPGHPLALLVDPNHPGTIYAGTEEGQVLTSTDNGQSWTPQQRGLPGSLAVSSLLALPADGHLLAGTSSGVFVSTDGAITWAPSNSGLPSNQIVDALSLGSADGKTIFAGTTNDGIYISHDGGASWSAESQGLPARADVYTLRSAPGYNRIFAGLIGNGIYVSQSGGAWATAGTGLPAHTDVYALATVSDQHGVLTHLYAGTAAGFYLSQDGGASWTASNKGLGTVRVLTITIDPVSAISLFVGTDNGVFQSVNAGVSWNKLAQALPQGEQVAGLVLSQQGRSSEVLFIAASRLYRYPGEGVAPIVVLVQIFGILGLGALFFWIVSRQNRYLRSMTPAAPPLGTIPGRREAMDARAKSHIRGGLPPMIKPLPAVDGPFAIATPHGPLHVDLTTVAGARSAVIFAGDRPDAMAGPQGSFPLLARRLQESGVPGLRLDYRVAGDLAESVADTITALATMTRQGIDRVVVVGWSFGAAVAIQAGILRDEVVGVVAIAPPAQGSESIEQVRGSLLLIQGSEDTETPSRIAQDLFARAHEPKELVLFPGDDHTIERHSAEMREKILTWCLAMLATPPSDRPNE